MADSCIISKEQLSQKEANLKSRLYGTAIHTTAPTIAQRTVRASPQKAVEHHKASLQAVTDKKMDTFLDDMRTQFVQSAGSNAIPQSLLYQQTRLMEK